MSKIESKSQPWQKETLQPRAKLCQRLKANHNYALYGEDFRLAKLCQRLKANHNFYVIHVEFIAAKLCQRLKANHNGIKQRQSARMLSYVKD